MSFLRKNYIFFVIIGILIITGAFLIFNSIQGKPPKPAILLISEMEWDYGTVKLNNKPTHIFTITNGGDEELIIERVRVSCGCIKTSISTKNIKPGKSAELKATFDTTGYEGKVNKDVYIKSNDPLEPEKRISLHIEVEHQTKPVISFSEREWNLGLVSQGDVPVFPFIIENKGDTDLIITKVDTYEHIKHNIIIPLRIPPAEIFEAALTYNSEEHELGEVREALWIHSNDPRRESVSLTIRGYIKERLMSGVNVSPVDLTFDLAINSEEGSMGKYTLENLGKKAAKIISVETSADYLVSLSSEFELNSGDKKELQVILLKDKAIKVIEEEADEYIYLTIALPIKICK